MRLWCFEHDVTMTPLQVAGPTLGLVSLYPIQYEEEHSDVNVWGLDFPDHQAAVLFKLRFG